jgi:2-methylisocitrate lyase-like PEP mutase family enzyme
MLKDRELVIAPGVFDGISAHLSRRTGHTAAYLTGAGVAASGFGLPDIGLVTQSEMVERARMVVRVLGDVPLIADADTGYGAPINVVRTTREYEAAGVAAIQIEDQVSPKKCGHLADKSVVDPDAFCRSLRAVLEARNDPDLVVVARTDARAPLGLDAAIERANLYASAGADVSAPLLINLVIGGLTPLESADRLRDLGYAIAIHPAPALAASTLSMLQSYGDLAGTDIAPLVPSSPASFFDLVGLAEWNALDARLSEVTTWA